MNDKKHFSEILSEVTNSHFQELLFAVGILLTGILLSFFVKKVSFNLLNKTTSASKNPLFRFFGVKQIHNIATTCSRLLFWLSIFFSFTISLKPFGVNLFQTLDKQLLAYLPNLVGSIVMLAAGFFAADLISRLVNRSSIAEKYSPASNIGHLVYYTVILITVLIVTKQLGFDIEFLTSLLLVFISCTLAGGAISFGLGSAKIVTGILETYYLKKTIRIGQELEGNGFKGKVVSINTSSVLLQTSEGVDVIPSKVLSNNCFRIKNVFS